MCVHHILCSTVWLSVIAFIFVVKFNHPRFQRNDLAFLFYLSSSISTLTYTLIVIVVVGVVIACFGISAINSMCIVPYRLFIIIIITTVMVFFFAASSFNFFLTCFVVNKIKIVQKIAFGAQHFVGPVIVCFSLPLYARCLQLVSCLAVVFVVAVVVLCLCQWPKSSMNFFLLIFCWLFFCGLI